MDLKVNENEKTLVCSINDNDITPVSKSNFLASLKDNSSIKTIELNLSGLNRLSVTDVLFIIGLYKYTCSKNQLLCVEGCKESVLKTLNFFRLEEHFSIEGE